MKLIDKDALVAWAKETYLCENASMIRKVCYKQLLEHLDTIEVKEEDLDKEIDKWYNNEASKEFENVLYEDIEKCAKYFFELGLRYKSSYVSIPSIDNTLKEMGIDPDSKEAKSIKESYYMALDKLWDKFKAQKGK